MSFFWQEEIVTELFDLMGAAAPRGPLVD